MTIAIVSHTSAGPGQNGGETSAIDTTGATLLIVSVHCYSATPSTANLSDSKGNSGWQQLTAKSAGSGVERIFYCENPTVGSGHTFTYSHTNTFPSICVASFSGAKTAAAAYDVENGATTASATSLAAGSVTPSEDNELIVSSIGFETTGTRSIDSSFTTSDHQNYSAGVTMGGALAYLIQTSLSAVNPTWSWTGSTSASACIATFKAAAGGGGVVIPVFMNQYRQRVR